MHFVLLFLLTFCAIYLRNLLVFLMIVQKKKKSPDHRSHTENRGIGKKSKNRHEQRDRRSDLGTLLVVICSKIARVAEEILEFARDAVFYTALERSLHHCRFLQFWFLFL